MFDVREMKYWYVSDQPQSSSSDVCILRQDTSFVPVTAWSVEWVNGDSVKYRPLTVFHHSDPDEVCQRMS